jgi:hypothetical protein
VGRRLPFRAGPTQSPRNGRQCLALARQTMRMRKSRPITCSASYAAWGD